MKITRAVKIILIAIVAIIAITLNHFGGEKQDELVLRKFTLFYSTEINGVLTYVGIENHGTGFVVNSVRYVFYPYNDLYLNQDRTFNGLASIGDRIFKSALSDTLYLFKEHQVFAYTFRKFSSDAKR